MLNLSYQMVLMLITKTSLLRYQTDIIIIMIFVLIIKNIEPIRMSWLCKKKTKIGFKTKSARYNAITAYLKTERNLCKHIYNIVYNTFTTALLTKNYIFFYSFGDCYGLHPFVGYLIYLQKFCYMQKNYSYQKIFILPFRPNYLLYGNGSKYLLY